MQQKNDVRKLCNDVLDYGDLLLIANKSHGKTHALMNIAREFKSLGNTRVFIFEDFPKWINDFNALAYYFVRDSDVIETEHTIDVESYFLRHERTYSVARKKDLEEFLKENQSGIFCMDLRDIERCAFFIYSIVNHFYRKAYLRAFKGYTKHERIVFIIEESQNVFDSSTISKKLFNRLRKIFSVARNLGLHFVMCSQRLQDLNTKIRGRTRLLIGRIGLDDYELKISKLLKHSTISKEVLSLPKGVFLYPTLETLVSFPLFKSDSKPYRFKPKEPEPEPKEPEKKGLIHRIIRAFTPKEPQLDIGENLEEHELSEDERQEHEDLEDEDLLLFQEEFSEDE